MNPDMMSIRQSIATRLKTLCSNIYYLQAADAPSFPYVIYSVERTQTMDYCEQAELEINVVDYGGDTSTCEKLTDSITEKLDHTCTIIDSDESIQEYHLYADGRNNVTAEDRNIVRRRITFDMRIYEE